MQLPTGLAAECVKHMNVGVARQQCHSHLADIEMCPDTYMLEPVGLMHQESRHPRGTTVVLWSRGKPLAWDITVQDTYTDAHVTNSAREAGVAASHTAVNKITK